MRIYAALIPVVFCLGANQLHAYELKYQPANLTKLKYRATAEVDVSGSIPDINPDTWFADISGYKKAIHELKSQQFSPDYYHYNLEFTSHDIDKLRVRLIGLPLNIGKPPANSANTELRDRISALKNAIMLQGDIDLSGHNNVLTFYRAPKERNILTQFFYLPIGDVQPGHTWSLPLQLIELGPGLFLNSSNQQNENRLYEIRHTDHGLVAEIHYLNNELVEGYAERVLGSEKGKVPFQMNITSYGYGEFLIDKGYWLQQTFIYSYKASGAATITKKLLFATRLQP